MPLMEITYNNQFDGEPIEQIPDPSEEYYLSDDTRATGFTYLFKLLWLIDKQPELIDKITEHLQDINLKIDGMSALHFVCRNYQSDKLTKVVKILIDCGADVNAKTSYNTTPLHYVCCYYQSYKLPKVVQLLIKCGADINAINNSNMSALQFVCRSNRSYELPEVVQILIKCGADVNVATNYNKTALQFVCRNYQSYKLPEVVQLLIKCGADVNAMTPRSNRTALQCFFRNYESNKFPEVAQILIESCSILDIKSIIKIDNCEIYDAIIKYHKHDPLKINPFLQYLNGEQIKLLKCFSEFKSSIQPIINLYNEIYYYPHNIGALLCESNFYIKLEQPINSNKSQFLFNPKN